VFDSRVVRQIREFAQREGIKLSLYVKLDAAAIRGGAGTRYEQAVVDAFEEVLSQLPVTQATDRMVGAAEIQTGMVLARDLLGPQGTLLLAAGFVFDSRVVRQIREFAQREGIKLSLYVKLDAAQQAPRPLPQTVQMGKG